MTPAVTESEAEILRELEAIAKLQDPALVELLNARQEEGRFTGEFVEAAAACVERFGARCLAFAELMRQRPAPRVLQ
jgi:hypothetical protein